MKYHIRAEFTDTPAWQLMVDSLLAKFSRSGLGGAVVWSWDTMSDSLPWAMESLADVVGVSWN